MGPGDEVTTTRQMKGKKKKGKKKRKDMSEEDKKYYEWLARWEGVDFSKLQFLPEIKERKQIMAHKKLKDMFGLRMLRNLNIKLGRDARFLYTDPSKNKKNIKGIFDKELTRSPHNVTKITPEVYD